MGKVYSYVRFSTVEQSKGNSLHRQLEASKKYCEENGLVLDDTLHFHDLGISAFKGANASAGKLGAFIQAVEKGKVESGSTLLVESLDRISRTEVLASLSLFTSILDKGITIVTLSDKKVYTRESISDIGNLLFSLIIMSRAHEESAIKSQRVKAAWDNKKKKAEELKIPLGKNCPAWLELVNGKYKIRPKADKAIQKVFDLYTQGHGYMLIVKEMNKSFETFTYLGRKCKSWNQSYIVRLINNKHVTGDFYGIPDYYPRIISDAQWFLAQQIKQSKRNTGGKKATVVNLFSHITKCGYCGGSMIRLNKSGDRLGKHYKHIAMVCDNGRKGITDCTSAGWNMDELEDSLLKTISELDINTIIGETDRTILKSLADNISTIEYELSKSAETKEKIVDAIELGGQIDVLVERLKTISKNDEINEKKLKEFRALYQIEFSKLEVASNAQKSIHLLKEKLADNDVRLQVNTEIKKIVKEIVLFNKIKKFVLKYHNETSKVMFKSGALFEFPPIEYNEDGDDWLYS
jgi:DNA invertase Pin-like site-specific DNA recombinase